MVTDEIANLLDEYWSLAFAEGKEGRSHDTADGDAQRVRSALEAALAPVQAEGTAEIERLREEKAAVEWMLEEDRKSLAAAVTECDTLRHSRAELYKAFDTLTDQHEALRKELEQAKEALKPFADLGRTILAEAPPDASFISIFKNCEGDWHSIDFDDFRRASALMEERG